MAEFRSDDGRDSTGLNVQDGLGFFFNRSSVREFIRANDEGVVTHRLFVYQNGSSPGQIENDERDTLTAGLPLLTPVWQERGDAPERRGRGPVPRDFVPQLSRRSVAGAGGGGGGGGGAGGGRGYGSGGAGGGYGSGLPVLAGPPELAGGRRIGLGYRHRTRKNKH